MHGDQTDEPWVEYSGAETGSTYRTYLHSNHQGSIIAHSDSSGIGTQVLTYDAYGIPGDNGNSRFSYTGQIALHELDVYYYKARIYHPKLGRFLQTDPVGYEDQMNLYAYVGNDPINMIDPTGKIAVALLFAPEIAALAKAAFFVGSAALAGYVGSEGINAYNESSENKGQTKPEVGDCPSCGGDTSNKPGKIGEAHGLKPKEVKDAIHGVKGNANLPNNPDVEVCNDCGEVFPQTEDGGLGDSIGNIEDEKGN